MMIRLQKYLAECGVASRRASEKLIVDGQVSVDGCVVTELGTKVDPATQKVVCNGRPVSREEKVWVMLNKPTGVICTSDDPEGRERVIDLVPDLAGRLYTVGRLDVMSEGLILLTNDGELAHRLMHPRHHVEKKYQVWIDRELSKQDIARMLKGLNCRGEMLKVLRVEPLKRMIASQPGYTLTLGEGRNRHIRRMMEALDCKVVRLLRVSVGPLRLEKLRSGEYRELAPWELEDLRKAVGL
ncbi:pseudouridine synthase [Tichowtungia aerotolerans]|uniref:Pseudouridine synthase n=1 Tax=Tichowtungia aerotolerans TaxID=2697043 RepID=A0A6P1M758_9BACT|nr:pseudouridine synthase [Tichowtungia aerotolerans]QHI69681.1 pseudouridine synthase [Tichowtungia aerotolerans]